MYDFFFFLKAKAAQLAGLGSIGSVLCGYYPGSENIIHFWCHCQQEWLMQGCNVIFFLPPTNLFMTFFLYNAVLKIPGGVVTKLREVFVRYQCPFALSVTCFKRLLSRKVEQAKQMKD